MSALREKVEVEATEESVPQGYHPEIQALVMRIQMISPEEMAKALYQVESRKEFGHLFLKSSQVKDHPRDLIFARGLIHEIETIYLDLARHLQARNPGSTQLMNAVFEFLGKTLRAMVQVPQLYCLN